jgi:hypothetical protein
MMERANTLLDLARIPVDPKDLGLFTSTPVEPGDSVFHHIGLFHSCISGRVERTLAQAVRLSPDESNHPYIQQYLDHVVRVLEVFGDAMLDFQSEEIP